MVPYYSQELIDGIDYISLFLKFVKENYLKEKPFPADNDIWHKAAAEFSLFDIYAEIERI